MREYSKEIYMDLYHPRDNFAIHKSVESKLLWGNPDVVPQPYVSFVVPTFARVVELREALESILCQPRIVPYEIVVVDNSAVLDDSNVTLQLIKELNDERILFYVNETNIGMTGNLNRLFELARGKYVSMLHDDDLLVDTYLEEMIRCIQTAEAANGQIGVIVASHVDYFSNKGFPKYQNKGIGKITQEQKIDSLFRGIGPTSCPTCGMLFNPKAAIEVGGFDDRYYPAMDYVIGYAILRSGYRVYRTADTMGLYRIAVNESVKVETLCNFCKCDYYFREFMYTESLFHCIFGFLFRNVQYSQTVRATRNNGLRFGNDIPLEQIAFTEGYGYYPIGEFTFKVFTRGVRFVLNRLPWLMRR